MRARVGHQLGWDSIDWGVKGLLHSCSFLEEDCNNERQVGTKMRGFWSHELIWSCSFWRISNNPDYGNCYTFNAIYNNDGVRNAREVTMTGESATLSIVLFLDQLFYTPLSLTKEAGARITIHDPKAFPMVDEYGMNLRPTTASHIGFQQVWLGYIIFFVLYMYTCILKNILFISMLLWGKNTHISQSALQIGQKLILICLKW